MNEWNDNQMGVDWATSVLKSDALKMNRIAPPPLTHNYHHYMGPRSAFPLLIILPTYRSCFIGICFISVPTRQYVEVSTIQ